MASTVHGLTVSKTFQTNKTTKQHQGPIPWLYLPASKESALKGSPLLRQAGNLAYVRVYSTLKAFFAYTASTEIWRLHSKGVSESATLA